jgi:hypothetical protein
MRGEWLTVKTGRRMKQKRFVLRPRSRRSMNFILPRECTCPHGKGCAKSAIAPALTVPGKAAISSPSGAALKTLPYICSAMAAITIQRRNTPAPDDLLLGSLTPTERRILKLIAAGNASKDIAEELSVHFRTV